MNNYQNVDSLSHLENFVEEGGFRNKINKDKIKTQKPFFFYYYSCKKFLRYN